MDGRKPCARRSVRRSDSLLQGSSVIADQPVRLGCNVVLPVVSGAAPDSIAVGSDWGKPEREMIKRVRPRFGTVGTGWRIVLMFRRRAGPGAWIFRPCPARRPPGQKRRQERPQQGPDRHSACPGGTRAVANRCRPGPRHGVTPRPPAPGRS